MLIHGGGSTLATSFGKIIPQLAKTNLVIAVELQAHGHTGDRDAPETFAQDAADVAELLRQLALYPNSVRSLVIISAFYKRDGAFKGFWDGFAGATLSNMPQIYHEEFLKINNDPALLLNMFNKDLGRMIAFKDWTEEEIRSITAPSLIVIGDKDVVTPEHAAEMYRLLPNSQLAILPGYHGSFMGEAMFPDTGSKMPELFVTMVDEFLAAI